MAQNITISNLTTTMTSARRTSATRTSIRSGITADPKTNLTALRAAMIKNGPTGGGGSRSNTKALALSYLSTVGCSSPESRANISKKGYSLLSDTTDTEMVENENILDLDRLGLLTNKTIGTSDKFSNVDDPFYNLDDGLSLRSSASRRSAQLRSEPDLSQFAADLNDYKNPTSILGASIDTVSASPVSETTTSRASNIVSNLSISRTSRSPGY